MWILAALAIYVIQTVIAPLFQHLIRADPQLMTALGPRDNPPEMPTLGGRFNRALLNYQEALMVFLPIALLIEFKGVSGDTSAFGAMLFVAARIAYPPAYAIGTPGLRSLVWGIGHFGIVMMLVELLSAL